MSWDKRWGWSIPLMIVDAVFTSIDVNYYRSIVPKVMEFEERFVRSGEITSLRDLSEVAIKDARGIWRNRISIRLPVPITRDEGGT